MVHPGHSLVFPAEASAMKQSKATPLCLTQMPALTIYEHKKSMVSATKLVVIYAEAAPPENLRNGPKGKRELGLFKLNTLNLRMDNINTSRFSYSHLLKWSCPSFGRLFSEATYITTQASLKTANQILIIVNCHNSK